MLNLLILLLCELLRIFYIGNTSFMNNEVFISSFLIFISFISFSCLIALASTFSTKTSNNRVSTCFVIYPKGFWEVLTPVFWKGDPCPNRVFFFFCRYNQVKMRSYWSRMDLLQYGWCPYEKRRDKNTHRGKHHVQTEIGVMHV